MCVDMWWGIEREKEQKKNIVQVIGSDVCVRVAVGWHSA
jgi:hypothetical protein